ncbi:glycosyltransferase family 22 protein [Microdochium trichocladiopsis]|uniref:Mannosyltransferase n=1 Tax=Microdochium trichocladiopsis TaxID=1682393 RepID=A0A9P8Y1R2_9PEZI|nr:glycosyltransferase family 22 protein [Microdochium trichocladiopsis]KAH7027511.1 glycosyltransferase family 22 protein [Microdochium trichocladiopsis]
MAALDILIALLIPTLVMVHLLVAPYTKVEESFNMQATHDILVYGMPTHDVHSRLSAAYDHFDFPGAVPRTFVGSVLLAGTTQWFVNVFGFHHAQVIIRATLGIFNAGALLLVKSSMERAFGRNAGRWYAVLQASQFHVLFYASRTLPNMFAFGLTTIAFSHLLPDADGRTPVKQFRLAVVLLTGATAVFRSELAILLAATGIYGLATGQITLGKLLPAFLTSFIFSLAMSIPIDSYFWQKILWPELWGFYYNAILGSSSEWGTSPWHYYFTSALPKILINPLTLTFLIPFALTTPGTSRQARPLAIPSLAFVVVYSLQPHKEARFIFYVVPPLTAVAALGANFIFTRRQKSAAYMLISLALVASVILSFVASTGMLIISSLNYPGGDALSAMWAIAESSSSDLQSFTVHTDVLSCMTGVTLFGQHPVAPLDFNGGENTLSVKFDKTEDETTLRNPEFWEKFDYVLAEDPAKVLGPFQIVGTVEGYAGVEFLKPDSSANDIEKGVDGTVLGKGLQVRKLRDFVRSLTGGWWVGPRMEPKIHILRKVREGEARPAMSS